MSSSTSSVFERLDFGWLPSSIDVEPSASGSVCDVASPVVYREVVLILHQTGGRLGFLSVLWLFGRGLSAPSAAWHEQPLVDRWGILTLCVQYLSGSGACGSQTGRCPAKKLLVHRWIRTRKKKENRKTKCFFIIKKPKKKTTVFKGRIFSSFAAHHEWIVQKKCSLGHRKKNCLSQKIFFKKV